jgi:signal transduction histidine kinase
VSGPAIPAASQGGRAGWPGRARRLPRPGRPGLGGRRGLRGLRGLLAGLSESLLAVLRALALFGLIAAGLVPLLAVAICVTFAVNTVQGLAGYNAHGGPNLGLSWVALILASLLYVRPLAGLTRRLAGQWFGVPIGRPYLPMPDMADLNFGAQLRARARWLATDPASWRDLLWLPVSVLTGSVLVMLPLAMALYGVVFTILPLLGAPIAGIPYLGALAARTLSAGLGGLAVSVAGLWLAPRLLRGYALTARALLRPTRQAELATRVLQLARTRADYVDAGAAELRRIERDLHDGAQARLVAMGMTLDAIEQQIGSSPEAARALLAEAKASSVKALAELRDLVRGIHPPVLADRGLGEAIRALALDAPIPVRASLELPGRPAAPVESAAYFTVSELLANVCKHAGARDAWIDVRHSAGLLRISIGDDGHGGADPARGSGLRGIERRLAAFDGVLAISSPAGGPTVVNLEIPCALSLPKTSSC